MDYPGASPEIVESEVTKKVEEGGQHRSPASTRLYSRSLRRHLGRHRRVQPRRRRPQGRRRRAREGRADPADAARRGEGAARARASTRQRVPIFNVAVLSDATASADAAGAHDLGRRRCCRSGWRTCAASARSRWSAALEREINIYLKPAAMEALGISADQVVAAVRSENQELPLGADPLAGAGARGADQCAHEAPRGLRQDHRARRKGRRRARPASDQVGRRRRRPAGDRQPGALQRPAHAAATVQKSQGENTIEVVDGLFKALAGCQAADAARRQGWRSIATTRARSASRSRTCKRTLIEGALLTVLIVFLFLNSWRSTVITGLTLPIALIGTFLFMYMFGFTINMITMMALSLCVGLLIDDAIVVRENIVRHVQMGKSAAPGGARRHAGDRPGGAGDHALDRRRVPADRLHGRHHRQVLPRVRHDHRRRGADLDVRQLHARPDAVEHLARPADRARPRHRRRRPVTLLRPHHRPRHGLVRPAAPMRLGRWLPGASSLVAAAQAGDPRASPSATFVGSFFIIPLLGAEFVPKADFSETQVNFYTPVGSSLEVTEAQGAAGRRGRCARCPRCSYTRHDDQQRPGGGQDLRRDLRAPGRPQGPEAQRRPRWRCRCASGWHASPASPSRNIGLPDLGGGKKPVSSRCRAPTSSELERLSQD